MASELIEKMDRFLCRMGLHRMKNHEECFFWDPIGQCTPYKADCSCGKKWWLSSKAIFGFFSRMERDE